MEIETTRDIARQILRHRSFSFQEFCIEENVLITTLTKTGKTRKVKIKDLYKRQQSLQYSQSSDWLVRVYDHRTGLLSNAKIKEVFKTGVKAVYKMILDNGKQIICTDQHKLLTFDGYKRLEEINTTDFVACNGVPLYHDKQWLLRAKDMSIKTKSGIGGIAELAGVKPVTISKWLKKHGLQFTKKEVALYTTAWNKGLDAEQQPMYGKFHTSETREQQRKSSRKGNRSNLYKTGNYSYDSKSWRRYVADFCAGYKTELLKECNYCCPISGLELTKDNCEIDHILPVCFRPDLAFEKSNLRVISKECHKKKTSEEIVRSKQTVSYSKVVSIEYVGERETYDMEIDHVDHNYVANGIITHNSQRYAKVDTDLFVNREPRLQDTKNRQNSFDTDSQKIHDLWDYCQNIVHNECAKQYNLAIEAGIAKEVARSLLPEGLTLTRIYMNGTLRSWIHYCLLRMKNGTQKEHADIARKAWDLLTKEFSFLRNEEITNNNQ